MLAWWAWLCINVYVLLVPTTASLCVMHGCCSVDALQPPHSVLLGSVYVFTRAAVLRWLFGCWPRLLLRQVSTLLHTAIQSRCLAPSPQAWRGRLVQQAVQGLQLQQVRQPCSSFVCHATVAPKAHATCWSFPPFVWWPLTLCAVSACTLCNTVRCPRATLNSSTQSTCS